MSELSIFIDESGDFGTYDIRSPYYIITMVFHDQSCDISEPIAKLRRDLSNLGIEFFGNLRDLKKNYLKPLAKFEWK